MKLFIKYVVKIGYKSFEFNRGSEAMYFANTAFAHGDQDVSIELEHSSFQDDTEETEEE